MQNLWPDGFAENDSISAKNLFEEQAKLLPRITNGVVFAEVKDLDLLDAVRSSLNNDFSFRFDVFGKFLAKYRFTVLMFSHDITLYPVKFKVDELIGAEIGIKRSSIHTVGDPEALRTFAVSVLNSKRLKAIIGSIIRLSK